FRVAPLRPSLATGIRIVRQLVRDQVWHVLVEPGSGRQLRLNPAAYAFAGRCDGRSTVQEVWQALLERMGEQAPTQDEVLRLLAPPSSYAIAWVAYPLVKGLHELGHALAVRLFGGAVREVGLSLLMLTPAPYVDASAANAFPSARRRAIVSGAGIAVEL